MSGSDDDTRPVSDEVEVLEGWLEKHSDWLGQWNRRWFRLKGRVLSYKVDQASADKGVAHLHGLRTENKGQHIRVWTENSDSWLLRAPDADSHGRWLEAIKHAVLANENRVVSAPSAMLRSDSVGSSLDSSHEVRPHHRSRSATRSSRGVTPTDARPVVHGELLRGYVKKRSAWLKQWNTRFVVIDGVDMVYSEKEDGKLRGRHTVVSVDPTEEPIDIKVTTSTNEAFCLRFETVDTAKHWTSVLRNSLQTTMTLRWQPIENGGRDAAVFLRASNHAAQVYDRDGAEHLSLIFFGGMSSTLPASAKQEEKAILCNELIMVKLSGDHEAVKLSVKAFQEGPGANVKPGPREGHACTIAHGRFYIHGGANRSAVLGDMWYVELAQSQTLQWTRVTNPQMQPPVVPIRCGHAMINVDDDIWLIGGFDSHGQAVPDVLAYDPTTNTTKAGPTLPEPRARHACATNSAGMVLCVGGTASRHVEDACNMGFIIRPGAEEGWQRVDWRGHELPKMVSPTLTPCGRKGWLLTASDGVHSVQVYMLRPSRSSSNVVHVELLNCAGDLPRMHHGLSTHHVNDYLYLVGDCSLPPIGPAMRRLLLPPSVTKHAPRIPSMGSMTSLPDSEA